MTLHSKVKPTKIPGLSITSSPRGLSRIQDESCAAVIWERRPMEGFQAWIDALPAEQLPRVRTVLRPEMVREVVSDLADLSGLPESTERSMLVDDIAALASIFADVMQTPYIRLRLDVVTTNACCKFHIDRLTARLICTYRGSGTQYGIGTVGADPNDILDVSTGAPMLLRGTLWPETPEAGFLHRSPPIEGSGETRLVLVLDPMAEQEPEMAAHHLH